MPRQEDFNRFFISQNICLGALVKEFVHSIKVICSIVCVCGWWTKIRIELLEGKKIFSKVKAIQTAEISYKKRQLSWQLQYQVAAI